VSKSTEKSGVGGGGTGDYRNRRGENEERAIWPEKVGVIVKQRVGLHITGVGAESGPALWSSSGGHRCRALMGEKRYTRSSEKKTRM